MNQKQITNHNKLEFDKIQLAFNRNRVRSVFSDISNLEFSCVTIQGKHNYNIIKEQQKSQTTKRRNAIIPCQIKIPTLFNSYPEYQQQINKISKCSSLEKPILWYLQTYDQEIKQYEREIEQRKYDSNFDISQHCFTEQQFEKALDWMIYQIYRFESFSYESLFKTIELVHLYLSKTKQVRFKDLELISGCCIYLSSKLVDLNPIYIEDLINQVLECRFDNEQVLRQEKQICQVLNYNLLCTCSLQIVYRILQEIRYEMEQFYDAGKIESIKRQVLDNLLLMEFGNKFRQISQCNRAVSCILLTMIENKIDRRIVII
ncbi:unnamed protein product [Paramecium sonneborni]|uniref:Cyclin-like domain-containing protein n=1 Tax=Paramecium sonneborni TaxID=65129 RepID=A0A8S1NFQ7_9CILI|nr:unnamed protein product [Paramecium sonneborni]